MTITVYIPGDSGAVALGADDVAQAIAGESEKRGADSAVVRNGSRGLYWLEPMVEVATEKSKPFMCAPPIRKLTALQR